MSIKNLKPQMGKFRQGYFHPKNNPEKYIGDIQKIIFRSSWEYKFCKYCDISPNIIKWSSEPIPIPYISPLDMRQHTYNVDFYIRVKTPNGRDVEYIIEVKPQHQTIAPKKPEGKITVKKLNTYNESLKTFLINSAKFATAKSFAQTRGYQFMVLTERFFDGKNEAMV